MLFLTLDGRSAREHSDFFGDWTTRPGKHTKNCGTSPFLMGKSTISMGHFQ
jgi:hypothetical protein